MKFQPKTHFQLKRIFGLARQKGIPFEEEGQCDAAATISRGRVARLSLLSFDEANALIVQLGGDPMSFKFTPRRTRNYHNQQAGIKTIATAAHLKKLDDLWFAFEHRTASGLTSICRKTIKCDRPRTADECNKIVEAVKSMNKRENAPASSEPIQPKFRRTA